MRNLDCFKAYDVRGRIPDEINEALVYDIGGAYSAFVKPKQVAVGYDIRLSSPQLAAALKRGLMDTGVNVLDIGLWGTEGAYFATFAEKLDGGIMVTASHNPPDYNELSLCARRRGRLAATRDCWRCARRSSRAGCRVSLRRPAASERLTCARATSSTCSAT